MDMPSPRLKRKSLIWMVVLCLALMWCNLDHAGRISGSAEHGHSAQPVCLMDLCVTLTSSTDTTAAGKAFGIFQALLSLAILQGLNHRRYYDVSGWYSLAFSKEQIPKSHPKLYRLHAAYRI